MDDPPEVTDAPDAVKAPRAKGCVDFQNITFAYTDPNGRKLAKPAVQNINLSLEPGKLYALVGQSGAGKSTLFSLLLRFYDPDTGGVLLDGKDIRSMTQESLRSNIGIVTQDTFLFHETVKENIRYGRLDATDEEIIEAAKRAHLHEFVMTLKAGYDTVVGDAGSNLSGGQKQRVSIARAILRNAPILLLDEATSALDPETERNIKDAVHTLTEGKTVIAIAHRLSTVVEADQIIVMEQGGVVAKGTHQELLASCELYQRLHALSFQE
jgi:subfamily B ATP-binding cassette protein MsbA